MAEVVEAVVVRGLAWVAGDAVKAGVGAAAAINPALDQKATVSAQAAGTKNRMLQGSAVWIKPAQNVERRWCANKTMKIILTATSPSIDATVDPRFGRGAYFIVLDPDTLEYQAQENTAIGASGGAGSLAAQLVAKQNASAVVSGDFGPNAYNALDVAGIAMYLYGDCTSVRQAVERFKTGQLQRVGAPTSPGHHGGRR